MSKRPPAPLLYDLYAVLVHSGHSVHSGHYYAYVRAPNGIWHICDDTHVAQVRSGGAEWGWWWSGCMGGGGGGAAACFQGGVEGEGSPLGDGAMGWRLPASTCPLSRPRPRTAHVPVLLSVLPAQVAERQVMAQKAYILFYLKRQPGARSAPPPPPHSRSMGMAASPPSAPAPVQEPAGAARRQQDAQQQQQDVQQQRQQQRAAGQAAPAFAAAAGVAVVAAAPSKKRRAAVAAVAAVAVEVPSGSHKRRQQEPGVDGSRFGDGGGESFRRRQQQGAGRDADADGDAPQHQPSSPLQQPNGLVSRKPRLRGMMKRKHQLPGGDSDDDEGAYSPPPR